MEKIHINLGKDSYDIVIDSGLIRHAGDAVSSLTGAHDAAIITEDGIDRLYGMDLVKSLESAGIRTQMIVVPSSEKSRSLSIVNRVYGALVDFGLPSDGVLIALGGRVVGDITGFVAATYHRGIAYIQFPTSVLSQIGSAIGGKITLDITAGKNLVGAFWQPSLVLCDTDTLDTLPREIFLDGCAEVIKYAILYDSDFFHYLASTGPGFDKAYVIERCVTMKRDVVARDEFDTGERRLLNLGHTVGHGVEAKSNFTLSHGKSVAIGTAIIARSAVNYQLLSQECAIKIENLLREFCLPVRTQDSAKELASFALSDKKRTGGTVSLVVPRAIGRCEILSTPVEELENFIQAGL